MIFPSIARAILIVICLVISSCGSRYRIIPVSEQINYHQQEKAIVFVHGLTGNSQDTWKNPNSSLSFPELLDSVKYINENYAIHSVNYPSHLYQDNLSLTEIGDWFANELINEAIIGKNRYQEVVFIAHSLGNLVVRSALYNNSELFKYTRVSLIVSLAAPSEGSEIATLGSSIWLTNPVLSDIARIDNNQYLTQLNRSWDRSKGDTKIACAFETIPTAGIGKIISKESATRICTEESAYPVLADHSGIAKPLDQDDRLFKWVLRNITESSSEISKIFQNVYAGEKNIKYEQNEDINKLTIYLKHLNFDDALKFMIDYDFSQLPKITCTDTTLLLDYIFFADSLKLIEKIAPYIEKPIPINCIDKMLSKVNKNDCYRAALILKQL